MYTAVSISPDRHWSQERRQGMPDGHWATRASTMTLIQEENDVLFVLGRSCQGFVEGCEPLQIMGEDRSQVQHGFSELFQRLELHA